VIEVDLQVMAMFISLRHHLDIGWTSHTGTALQELDGEKFRDIAWNERAFLAASISWMRRAEFDRHFALISWLRRAELGNCC
jgi:hypothetical protein